MKQHEEARQKANEVRLARAALKREVKAGTVAVGELLAEPDLPHWMQRMPLEELLKAIPRYQQKAIDALLAETPIKYGALLGDLTYRKQRFVADRVAEWEDQREPAKSKRRAAAQVLGEGSNRKFKAQRGFGARVLG